MSEIRDPAIKLFGQTIGLTRESGFLNQKHCFSSTTSNEDKITLQGEFTLSEQENELNDLTEDSLVEPEASSDISDGTKLQDADKETSSPKSTKNEDPDDEKVLKKPEKLLPCPRCNSMETKFCYYNNYNVNQPRYFCKKCQRYWTAGGTMRNVPVGSGRRKNKSCSISNYHHLNVSDARVEAALRANGSVLRFGSDKPLCDSMVSALNLAEKSQNIIANGFHGPEQRLPAYDQSNGPCSTSEKEKNSGTQDLNWKNFQSYHPQVPYYPAPPWACTWSTPQWRSMVQPSAINPSGFPVSFYPAPPYWINVPWPSSTPSSDNTGSPTLGKHSRDGSMLNPSQSGDLPESEGERSVLIPKTLRIDDPDEAAKSSIWSTLGIKNDKADSIRGLRLFKAFNTKADHSNHEADSSLLLQANPAAFSRSLKFRERTQ